MEGKQGLTMVDTGATLAMGKAANEQAKLYVFEDYFSRKSNSTKVAQRQDLDLFCLFLAESGHAGIDCENLSRTPHAWQGVTWGLVEAFVKWQANKGYSVGSINRRLSTIKIFAKMAAKAEAIPQADYAMINLVNGYWGKEATEFDKGRPVTRIKKSDKALKKPNPVDISPIVSELLNRPDTPQGRRDSVMLYLLIEHGLRSSEVAILTVDNVDVIEGEMCFYRPKVDNYATHRLTPGTRASIRRWLKTDAHNEGYLLRSSRKGGALTSNGMSVKAIAQRFRILAQQLGVDNASPHDCRHYCATQMARQGHAINEFRDWFGWKSADTALNYIKSAKVAVRKDPGHN